MSPKKSRYRAPYADRETAEASYARRADELSSGLEESSPDLAVELVIDSATPLLSYQKAIGDLAAATQESVDTRYAVLDLEQAIRLRTAMLQSGYSGQKFSHDASSREECEEAARTIALGHNEADRKARLEVVLNDDPETNRFTLQLREADRDMRESDNRIIICKERCRLFRLLLAKQIGVTVGDI